MPPRKLKKAIKDSSEQQFEGAMYRLGRVCYLAGWAARDAHSSQNPPLSEAEVGWEHLQVDLFKQFGVKQPK
jgi:hypothetical protein